MNYRRLWNSYRCHRLRRKTHYQIFLEGVAKLMRHPAVSPALMRQSLRHHGLGDEIRFADTLKSGADLANGLASNEILTGRFFLDLSDEAVWNTYRARFAHKIKSVVENAERICRHEFNLLGSGPVSLGEPIDWHVDPATGYRWPKQLFSELRVRCKPAEGSDVKFPWELSRMQHLPTLGKAYCLTKDLRYAREIINQIAQWMDDNPCPYGVNWLCPMDVAIRILNIVWGYLLIQNTPVVTHEFRSRLAVSIFEHGQFVLYNLEYGLSEDGSIGNGNHYLSDIVGLLHLGLMCPQIKAAEEWRCIGVHGLIEEMKRQVYPDGVNCESSISYHRLVLELFTAGALICQKNEVPLPGEFWKRLERMFDVVLSVTRPDGHTPIVGDADDGRLYILSDYGDWDRTDFRYLLSIGAVLFGRPDMKSHSAGFSEEAFWLLGSDAAAVFDTLEHVDKGLESAAFRDAGLYVLREDDSYLIACCGAVSAASHKHNDLLSFELYTGDRPFIVDPGSYVYTRDEQWRNLFRSTRYHNTVVIDGQEQNRFIPGQPFKLVPDSRIDVHDAVFGSDCELLDAEHTGYTRLAFPVRHRRRFLFHKSTRSFDIVDFLIGSGEHKADWYFHYAHGVSVKCLDGGTFQSESNGTTLNMIVATELPYSVETVDGWISPKYGEKRPAHILHLWAVFKDACSVTFTFRTS